MSEVMEQAILRMPPECWSNDVLDQRQRHARYVQAADDLERLRAENETMFQEKTKLQDKNKEKLELLKDVLYPLCHNLSCQDGIVPRCRCQDCMVKRITAVVAAEEQK